MISRKIYFICPTNPHPSGGVKQIYRMVDILNKNGFDAAVIHKKADQRETWFPNNTKVIHNPYLFKLIKYLDKKKLSISKRLKLMYLKKISFGIETDSILVFPEIYSSINKIEPFTKKVIFNQNCYYTFNGFPLGSHTEDFPYNKKNILETIVVSEDSKNYIKTAFPGTSVHRIRLGIDASIFNFSKNKEKIIAFMPRKLSEDSTQIINIFQSRNKSSDWKIMPIDNRNENEVAEILKKAAIFLSFNHKEGFGLPPVEAMSCGCYVIGYRGQAGKEYFNPEFSSSVEDGNIIEFVLKIEEATKMYDRNPQEIIDKGHIASEFVLANYSTSNEEKDIINIWNSIMTRAEEQD
ncbi:glycosyltransferase [Chryseobacterium sp. WG14]|uniref:glycosyltransferase n=1 Tax=Chryseobacterium sp. WG14 TaxID=2926909 RepID=UPI00211E39E6|nr:glycosyltransferase [Chryseobacterium sp. WG14]MCQ9641807.1 glycosyltransferase [Chryseobacterium sp. WG14]